ncbi:S-formylglutathione hydrolase [Morganella morganii]|jgi:S-formylglutathione hydrolase|uniref:S-formylglutathione hydrolase n=1 Tax=Morganella morganii TaxID=582 RepID=A0AAN5MJS9_MORMO|nr:S-formylglutathione hydrolase [Morganella morganii]HAT3811214.1 S-formylglutathione hydrolase [Morganella morganii]HED3890801.1 S-formylglutathione hydrolase [Morganella morganii]HED3891988.1 S-formylglutathione hydrolase [Morganella morganii]
MERIEHHVCFGGSQEVWRHHSAVTGTPMTFSVFLPPQAKTEKCPVLYWLSGLTCNEQNFITKAGAQRYAAEHGLVIVAPDTSPRGSQVADDKEYDLGQGAGFYVNATQEPWKAHYQMYDYILDELHALVTGHFGTSEKRGICGHSMGGHGALVLALRNPEAFFSVSAFAPIVSPSQVPWGEKAFSAYLGEDKAAWEQYDAVKLIESGHKVADMLVDQGLADTFFSKQLKTGLLKSACETYNIPHTIRVHAGYDHSYYFIASFIADHIAWHAARLNA